MIIYQLTNSRVQYLSLLKYVLTTTQNDSILLKYTWTVWTTNFMGANTKHGVEALI